jgi:hypothetical protein
MPGRLVLIGAGGHAHVVLDAARLSGWTIDGLVDRDASSREIDGVRVLGDDTALADLRKRGATHAVVAVGSLQPGALRAELFGRLRASGLEPAVIVHPAATVASSASLGAGTTPAQGKGALVTYLGRVTTATDDLIAKLKKAGVPNVSGGVGANGSVSAASRAQCASPGQRSVERSWAPPSPCGQTMIASNARMCMTGG